MAADLSADPSMADAHRGRSPARQGESPATRAAGVELSVVIPLFNEQGNVAPLVHETVATLARHARFEIVCVDDHSEDQTVDVLSKLAVAVPSLRVLVHSCRRGQSAAMRTGVRAARGAWIVTMDGDGQNDPSDIPHLLAMRDAAAQEVKLFAGWRVERKDGVSKRWASRWANRIRSTLLRDHTPDTGCGLKLFERSAFLDLPYFDHMHRYLPALMQRAGWKTESVPVRHRPRLSGYSKYNNLARALAGLYDLIGVTWLIRRSSVERACEIVMQRDRADG